VTAPLFPPFRPRLPWITADLQTVRNFLLKDGPNLARFRSERLEFPMPDGDRLVATLNWPERERPRPLVWLIHGITGWQDSLYMRRTAEHLLEQGYPTLRFNLRGAGPSAPLCRFSYHAGRTEDLDLAVRQLEERIAGRGMFAIGFSLGGNLLLKYLGEQGSRAPFRGAVSVSAPIRPKEAQLTIMRPRNLLYHRYILDGLREETARPNAAITAAQRAWLPRVKSVYEYDERFVAPANGFAGADDYYARTAALPLLPAVGVPTLVIHALDDPWIPAAAYRDFDWSRNANLVPLLPDSGGHVGFHAPGHRTAWHDRCATAFFAELER
jgi:uncharacterized protein